jgi:hypothetical protein
VTGEIDVRGGGKEAPSVSKRLLYYYVLQAEQHYIAGTRGCQQVYALSSPNSNEASLP